MTVSAKFWEKLASIMASVSYPVCTAEAQLVEDHEEVDRHVDNVDDQAAEVHLSQCAKQNRHIDQLVDALHRHDEAHHYGECEVDEAKNHEDGAMLLAFLCWGHHGLTHALPASQC
eukprot:CAMPEP_0170463458 /NCGR_PEP_ID=MMETSP0123-20130129/8558_1 /TAXON_ID=182087 /ORGANISM="Favella ehrenbergii, Strain Fehren 1" /LENGTH=115 /DNA_ID=CAMNT_0010728887 /DNA_START=439 /DNA_END=785 /DNA_ORIENTATION=-